MINSLLNTLVGRNAKKVRPRLAKRAGAKGPLQEPAVKALSYLPPDRADGLKAMRSALGSGDAKLRAAAAEFVIGSDWYQVPELREELTRREKADPSGTVRKAIGEARKWQAERDAGT